MNIDTNGVEIEDKVRDRVTGFEGTVIGITQWNTGCARATIQPPMPAKLKEEGGKMPEAWNVDCLTVEVLEPGPRHAAAPRPELVGAGKGGPPTISVRDR